MKKADMKLVAEASRRPGRLVELTDCRGPGVTLMDLQDAGDEWGLRQS